MGELIAIGSFSTFILLMHPYEEVKAHSFGRMEAVRVLLYDLK